MKPWQRWVLTGGGLVVLLALPAAVLGGALGPRLETLSGPTLAVWVYGILAFDVILPTPIPPVTTLAGHQLGFVAGAACAWAGLCTGNTFGFGVGRLLGRAGLSAFLGEDEAERAAAWVAGTSGSMALAAARPVPVLSEATVLLAGATGAPWVRSLAVCWLANAGMAAVYAGAGALSAELQVLPLAVAAAIVPPALFAFAAARVRR